MRLATDDEPMMSYSTVHVEQSGGIAVTVDVPDEEVVDSDGIDDVLDVVDDVLSVDVGVLEMVFEELWELAVVFVDVAVWVTEVDFVVPRVVDKVVAVLATLGGGLPTSAT